MGMFDYVDVGQDIPCPACGAVLGGWQSKDGPCHLGHIPLSDVDNFYTHCNACGQWVEYRRRPKLNDLRDFELVSQR